VKHQDIITGPELSKKLKALGIFEEPLLGFWYELHRIYENHDHQRAAQKKNKTVRWEFNLPEESLAIYQKTTFSDEIGTYRLKLVNKIPAYTYGELMEHLPVKIRLDDDYIRRINVEGDRITICYKSKRTSFILGETIVDKDLTSAVAKMLLSLNMQGCVN